MTHVRIAVSCLVGATIAACGHGMERSERIGLVLSGGGAKGAYEVGVWQEMQAVGLASCVTAISGTSIGALNAALFATKPGAAEKIWLENIEDVFTLNTNRVAKSIQRTVDDVSRAVDVAEETGDDWKGAATLLLSTLVRVADAYAKETNSGEIRTGYIDSSRLAAALDEVLPREWPKAIPSVYATAVEKGGRGVSATWRLNDEKHERRVLMLRASAAIPFGFDTVLIDGKPYVDGGWESEGGDNVPLKPIIDNHPDIKTVIVVYLKDEENLGAFRRTRNRYVASAAGIRLVEIIPSEDISGTFGFGGVFDTSPETARRLISLGRKDARKVLARNGLD